MRYLLKIIIEYATSGKYNSYRIIMNNNTNIRDLLAEARATHFAMKNGAITYREAQVRVQPILLVINNHIGQISRRHKVKPQYLKFQDLGRNL